MRVKRQKVKMLTATILDRESKRILFVGTGGAPPVPTKLMIWWIIMQDNWIRFKKKDKTTWPAEHQACIIRLDITNKATKTRRWKIIGNVWLNHQTRAFCYRDHNLTVSIPSGEDKTKIYYQVI